MECCFHAKLNELKNNYTEKKNINFIKEGRIACYRPMSCKDVRQYKANVAEQRRINNDPRVVAARIQANAIRQAQVARQWANIGKGFKYNNYYNSSNQNSVIPDPSYDDDSFSLNRKSTTYRATRLSDGIYNVRKRNSAPRF